MSNVPTIIKKNLAGGFADAHGNRTFSLLSKDLKKQKTEKILDYFRTTFFQDPISWESIKDAIWPTEDERIKNKFSFMQGDIVQTKMVLSLGQSQLAQDHDTWLVLTPTCDIARGLNFIKVAKVFRVDESDKLPASNGHEDYMNLVLACKFATNKNFPLPSFSSDGAETLGYYADLTTPYYIEREKMNLAVPKYSLKFDAWHMLNMFLMQTETRSNSADEPLIRCKAEGIAVPNVDKFQVRVYIGAEIQDFRIIANHFHDADHSQHLKDNDEYLGKWIQISGNQQVYWMMKKNLDIDQIVNRERFQV